MVAAKKLSDTYVVKWLIFSITAYIENNHIIKCTIQAISTLRNQEKSINKFKSH